MMQRKKSLNTHVAIKELHDKGAIPLYSHSISPRESRTKSLDHGEMRYKHWQVFLESVLQSSGTMFQVFRVKNNNHADIEGGKMTPFGVPSVEATKYSQQPGDCESRERKEKDPCYCDSLRKSLLPVLWFGKIIGAIPPTPKFRLNAVVILILSVNVVVETIGVARDKTERKSPFDFAASVGAFLFYVNGLTIYIYMFRNSEQLMDIIRGWTQARKEYVMPNTYVYLASFVILFSAVTENMVYHVKLCPPRDEKDYDFLKCTYYAMHQAWPNLIPVHKLTAVFLIITNKLAVYVWNFMDVLIIALSRGLYHQFKSIAEQKVTPELWPHIRGQYDVALRQLMKFESFLSPLIFISYAINMFAMCMHLNLWLTPSNNNTLVESLYSIWSSFHLVLRVGLVSVTAAKINEAAMDVLCLTRECPPELYSLDIYRLEGMVQSAHIGLSGLKCFFITKRFLLSLVGVVFTFEVVLLQKFQTGDGK